MLVNNAGVSLLNSAFQDEESYEANWATTLDVNLTAHSRLIRLCLPYLREAEGGGRVVNIASTESIVDHRRAGRVRRDRRPASSG